MRVAGALLPTFIASKISAACRNGLLKITLPKKEDARSKTIKIDVGP